MSKNRKSLLKLTIAAMMLALALYLRFLTGQIPQIGSALSPMHIPALLAGFFCGPLLGAAVGFIAPLLRFALFGMPPIMPTGVAMCFELCTYAFVAGTCYRMLKKGNARVYVALIVAMLCGRVVWGAVRAVLAGFGKGTFGWQAFVAGAFTNAIPGIILHIVLIPIIVIAVTKAFPKLAD